MSDNEIDICLNVTSIPSNTNRKRSKKKTKNQRGLRKLNSSELSVDQTLSKSNTTESSLPKVASKKEKKLKKTFKTILPTNEGDYSFDEYNFSPNVDNSRSSVNKTENTFEKNFSPDKKYSSAETNKFSSLFTQNPVIPVHIGRAVNPVNEPIFSSKTFEDLPIHRYMVSNLKDNINLDKLTTVQQKAIPVLLSGKDALVRSQTGSGKTLAYAIPIIEALQSRRPKLSRGDGIRALVVVPTRELALQSYELFVKLVKSFAWLVPGYLVGGEKRKSEKARLRKGINILIGTPGRLLDHIQKTQSLHLNKVEWLILDEGDRLLDMGYEKAVSDIVSALNSQKTKSVSNSDEEDSTQNNDDKNESKSQQTVLLSATLTTGVERLAGLALKDPIFIDAAVEDKPSKTKKKHADIISALGSDIVIPYNLEQYFIVTPPKLRLVTLSSFIIWRCKLSNQRKILIFCATQDMVDYLTELLSSILGTSEKPIDNFLQDENEDDTDHKVVDVEFFKLHGNMTQKERTDVFKTFRGADSGVLLCTDVAARGLDLPCVDWIVQYNAPFSVSDYVHRVGRTARVGSSGSALLFLTPSEIEFVSRLEDRRIRLKEEKMDQCLKRLLDNNPHQRGGPHTPEEAATALQLRFENAVLERQELHDLGCKAYMSWVRFYASYPKATRDVFNFKELHLGHFAKSFALRDPPRWIGDFGKWKGHSDQKRQRKNQRDGDYGTSGTHSGKINKKRKVFSEFDSGLEPVKKKSKPL